MLKTNALEKSAHLMRDNSLESNMTQSYLLQNLNTSTKSKLQERLDTNEDLCQTQLAPQTVSKPGQTRKDKLALKNIQQQSASKVAEEVTEVKQPKKYTKLIEDLTKLEGKLDKHEIEATTRSSSSMASFEKMYESVANQFKYYDDIFAQIKEKYEMSELNAFKVKMTKGKQSSEGQVIVQFYHLFSRVMEAQAQNKVNLEKYYGKVIESKNFKIGDLETRLYNAHAELERIEKDRLKLKLDVELELNKLDQLGSLYEFQKPLYLTGEEQLRDPNTEDPVFALNDLYQFLLFEGEIAKDDPFLKSVKINYKGIEEIFTDNLAKVQRNTAEKIIKRIYRNVVTEE